MFAKRPKSKIIPKEDLKYYERRFEYTTKHECPKCGTKSELGDYKLVIFGRARYCRAGGAENPILIRCEECKHEWESWDWR